MLLLSVSQQFHPLPSVEADQELADQLRKLYISKEAKHGPRVSCISVSCSTADDKPAAGLQVNTKCTRSWTPIAARTRAKFKY